MKKIPTILDFECSFALHLAIEALLQFFNETYILQVRFFFSFLVFLQLISWHVLLYKIVFLFFLKCVKYTSDFKIMFSLEFPTILDFGCSFALNSAIEALLHYIEPNSIFQAGFFFFFFFTTFAADFRTSVNIQSIHYKGNFRFWLFFCTKFSHWSIASLYWIKHTFFLADFSFLFLLLLQQISRHQSTYKAFITKAILDFDCSFALNSAIEALLHYIEKNIHFFWQIFLFFFGYFWSRFYDICQHKKHYKAT